MNIYLNTNRGFIAKPLAAGPAAALNTATFATTSNVRMALPFVTQQDAAVVGEYLVLTGCVGQFDVVFTKE